MSLHLLFKIRNLHLEQRKYILPNWKCFSFILQKSKDPIIKTDVWCFAYLSTKICLLGCFLSLTWKYLGMWWHMIFNIYSLLSTCKLCIICLFRCFLSRSILFWWISVIYSNFFATLLWIFMWHILKVIWKLCIDILKVLFFTYKKLIEKNKAFLHDHYNSCAKLFGTSIFLLQLLISL